MSILLLLWAGCTEDKIGDGTPLEIGESVSSFSLLDVNPSSSSYQDYISPQIYNSATAWYFGHAT